MPHLLEENLDACEAGEKSARGGGGGVVEKSGRDGWGPCSKGLVGFYSG